MAGKESISAEMLMAITACLGESLSTCVVFVVAVWLRLSFGESAAGRGAWTLKIWIGRGAFLAS